MSVVMMVDCWVWWQFVVVVMVVLKIKIRVVVAMSVCGGWLWQWVLPGCHGYGNGRLWLIFMEFCGWLFYII